MRILAKSRDRLDYLVQAFSAAEYVVDAGNEDIVIHTGQPTPALDRLLDGRPWAVITAYNPDGVARSDTENAEAQKILEQCLRALRPTTMLTVRNHDPSGHWPDEPAWLFTIDEISSADALAQRFGQRAIVTGHAGKPASLRIYGLRISGHSGRAARTAPAVIS